MFVREGVTLAEVRLGEPGPFGDDRGAVYVTAEAVAVNGATTARAFCFVKPGDSTGAVGAVANDWTPPE